MPPAGACLIMGPAPGRALRRTIPHFVVDGCGTPRGCLKLVYAWASVDLPLLRRLCCQRCRTSMNSARDPAAVRSLACRNGEPGTHPLVHLCNLLRCSSLLADVALALFLPSKLALQPEFLWAMETFHVCLREDAIPEALRAMLLHGPRPAGAREPMSVTPVVVAVSAPQIVEAGPKHGPRPELMRAYLPCKLKPGEVEVLLSCPCGPGNA